MLVTLTYDRRTAVVTEMNGSALDFATNTRRRPVAFRGTLREPVLMRQLMLGLHEVILSDNREQTLSFVLDPVITVHPDEMFFEAFSTDQSAYGRLSASLDAFDVQGETSYGTTNIDFTFALRAALQDLRSSRRTDFAVGAGGFGMQTDVGAAAKIHYEAKVDLPDEWVRGFLQVQSALAMRPFTFDVRPVDLLNIIYYFTENRARKPPHGLRFEFKPGEPINAVLEPWNERFTMQGTQYDGYPRTVRLWGRKRLELLLGVLPYADRVTVGLIGRGLPHFYICQCGPYKFTLMLSGWVRNDWAAGSALDLLAPQADLSAEQIASVYNFLNTQLKATHAEVEAHTLLKPAEAEAALFALCRDGRAIYDPTTRRYRSRELFAETLNAQTITALDPRIAEARQMIADGRVTVHSIGPNEARKNETKIMAAVSEGSAVYSVVVAVDMDARLRFATCECEFFREHVMGRGPCPHILAAKFAGESAQPA